MRSRRQEPSIPEVNLIPMLNVLLGVLAFFVIITLTLSQPKGVTVVLPADSETPPPEELIEEEEEESIPPMMVQLLASGQIAINDEPIPEAQVESIIQDHLGQGDDALVFLLADASIPYEEVMDFILAMKRLGGDQVSLALEES